MPRHPHSCLCGGMTHWGHWTGFVPKSGIAHNITLNSTPASRPHPRALLGKSQVSRRMHSRGVGLRVCEQVQDDIASSVRYHDAGGRCGVVLIFGEATRRHTMTSTGESPLLLYCACTGHLGSPSLFPSAGSVARLSGVSPPLSLSLSLSLSLCGPRTPPGD